MGIGSLPRLDLDLLDVSRFDIYVFFGLCSRDWSLAVDAIADEVHSKSKVRMSKRIYDWFLLVGLYFR